MKVKVKNIEFKVQVENNDTVTAFEKMLPLKIEMQELNSNEKYCYLDKRLPSKPIQISNIHEGDVLLYGDNCVVIFYKSFSTAYAYTKIGTIKDSAELAAVLGKGSVAVEFY